jgi:hypothetical protein
MKAQNLKKLIPLFYSSYPFFLVLGIDFSQSKETSRTSHLKTHKNFTGRRIKKFKSLEDPSNERYLSSWTRVISSLSISLDSQLLTFALFFGRIRFLEEKPIEYKEDSPQQHLLLPTSTRTKFSSSSSSPLERMRMLSEAEQSKEDDEGDEEDSVEEEAKRTIEGKFLFHSRFHHVLDTLHREGSNGTSARVIPRLNKALTNTNPSPSSSSSSFLYQLPSSQKKSFNVFGSSSPSPPRQLPSHHEHPSEDDQTSATATSTTPTISESISLSSSFTSEQHTTPGAGKLASPRAAMIREGQRRHQIPYVVKELVGNVEVDQTAIINLAGQGIGDEKMNCLVQSLPYFINVDEINISSQSLCLSISVSLTSSSCR